jgi:hypothetical protein
MSSRCPHCGGAILLVVDANPAQIPNANQTQILPQSEIAHGSKSLSTEERKTYNQGYTQAFQAFWSVYPLHRDKRKAQIAWRNAIRRLGANANAILIAGAIRYRDDPNRLPQYTKYAEGWLNGDGWEDEPLPPRISPNGRREEPPSPRQMKYEAEAWMEEHRAKD